MTKTEQIKKLYNEILNESYNAMEDQHKDKELFPKEDIFEVSTCIASGTVLTELEDLLFESLEVLEDVANKGNNNG